MMKKMTSPNTMNVPFNMVGSTVFGRYNKISSEQTYNMIISDDWMVPYAGYQAVLTLSTTGKGRGIFNSSRSNRIIAVAGIQVFSIAPIGIFPFVAETQIGTIGTLVGDGPEPIGELA